MNLADVADIVFVELLEKIYKNPSKAIGQRKPRIHYITRIKDYLRKGYTPSSSIKKVYAEITNEYKDGLIPWSTWIHINPFFRKILKNEKLLRELDELYEKLRREDGYFEGLLIKMLEYIINLDKITEDNLSKEAVAKALNVDLETINRFKEWLEAKGYLKIVSFIIKAKAAGIQP